MLKNCGCSHYSPEYDDFEERWICAHCGVGLAEIPEDGGTEWDENFQDDDSDDGDFW